MKERRKRSACHSFMMIISLVLMHISTSQGTQVVRLSFLYDKYGLHKSSWLILSQQAHEHISFLIRYIADIMGPVLTPDSGESCLGNSCPRLSIFLLISMDISEGSVRGRGDEEQPLWCMYPFMFPIA